MKKARRVILFLVEGRTDKESLSLILSRLIEADKSVKFHIVGTDITTDYDVSPSNIECRISKEIKDFIDKRPYEKRDFCSVIHLMDCDGAFIPQNKIIKIESAELKYTEDCIYTCDPWSIQKRNEQKKENMLVLCRTKQIFGTIPYRAYFFSSNLEHVLHDKINLCSEEKRELAEKFPERFEKAPQDFVEFISSDIFALKEGYHESWEFIAKDVNSLKRYTNFNQYFEK